MNPEIARAARAAARDNATDRVVAAMTLLGMPYGAARELAEEAVEALAGWLRDHGEPRAADALIEF